MARPSIFTKELGETICRRLSEGESLRAICRDDEMPAISSVMRWLIDTERKEFWEQYAQARESQAEHLFNELLEIADESDTVIEGDDKSDGARVQAKKLRVDTRKWVLAKMLPKKYGEKLDLTTDGEKLPAPIYGGKSVHDTGHNSD